MADRPTRPSDATIKRLFARSGNRCAYPRCPLEIVHGEAVVGEVCHIRAARPDRPRYAPDQSTTGRHGYDNLILLCRNHHKVIDDDPEAYTVERVLRMKADQESGAATLTPGAIERAARLLINESVVSVNQSGGITAHTVNQTIHVHPPAGSPASAPTRDSILAGLREFHRGRVNGIAAGKAPVPVLDRGILVLHVLPFSTAGERQAPSFDEIGQN
ncbi:MAG: HNH endonuclease signature motif containing protein, partial [Terracidiphilus sp.]